MSEIASDRQPMVSRRTLLKAAVGGAGLTLLGNPSETLDSEHIKKTANKPSSDSSTTKNDAIERANSGEISNDRIIENVEQKVDIYDQSVNQAYQKICKAYELTPQALYKTDDSHPKWYFDKPDALKADIENYQDFFPWLDGNVPEKPAFGEETKILFNLEDPPQRPLASLAQQTLETMLLIDRQRVRSLLLGADNVTNTVKGEVSWCLPDAYALLPDSPDTHAALIHEITHAAIPNLRKDFLNGRDGKFFLGTESGSYPDLLKFKTMWMDTIQIILPFFQERFFNAKGDQTIGFIKDNGVDGLLRAKHEFVAMLCADYIIPSKENMPPDEWPEDIKHAVDVTWNFIRHGNKSNLQPIPAEEIANVRERILGYYTQYKAIRKSEQQ